jgi:hypothetical protein
VNKYSDTARRGGDKTVPKFMVIHEAPSLALKEFLATPVGQNALTIGMRQLCTFDAYWVRAWAVPEQEKFYCEWNAKDAESIRRVFEKAPQPSFLIESIYEMRVIDAEQDVGR